MLLYKETVRNIATPPWMQCLSEPKCFCIRKQLGILQLLRGCNARYSQGYTPQCVARTHLYTRVKRDNVASGVKFSVSETKPSLD